MATSSLLSSGQSLTSVPDSIPLRLYGGDTRTITITAPGALVDGMEWLGQIRETRTSTEVAATFQITPPVVLDGPAYATLTSSVSAGLVAGRDVFKGFYDIQISGAGGIDPVTTIIQGTVQIDADVSRVP